MLHKFRAQEKKETGKKKKENSERPPSFHQFKEALTSQHNNSLRPSRSYLV